MNIGFQSEAGIFKGHEQIIITSTASKQNYLKWYYEKSLKNCTIGVMQASGDGNFTYQIVYYLHMKPWRTHVFYWRFYKYIQYCSEVTYRVPRVRDAYRNAY